MLTFASVPGAHRVGLYRIQTRGRQDSPKWFRMIAPISIGNSLVNEVEANCASYVRARRYSILVVFLMPHEGLSG